MKKVFIILVCLLLILTLCGCQLIFGDNDPSASQTSEITQAPTDKPSVAPSKTPKPKPSLMPVETPEISMIPTATPAQTPIGMSPDPINTAPFYSSYAHMVSYDPARGWADFDYFDMLTGQDAIDWMVAHEGYTLADAQATVGDWGDGEYWYKNTSSTLRTIDLKNAPIKLMYLPDGTQVPGSISVDSDVSDVFALYNLDPAYLFDHFFFYIHVDGAGNVTLVEQIYWC